jgi:hypothetical protein
MRTDVEQSLMRFASEVESAAGTGLRAIVLYGSGATGQHVPGRSDLNLLVILEEISLPLLSRLQKLAGGWGRSRISTPLFVDPRFLPTSTDSYPLEILGMMSAYRVIRGDDPLADLRVAPGDVRLQVEREVKAKRLLLRRGYIESRGKERPLREILSAAVPAIEAIVRGMLFVGGGDWRASGPAFREASGEVLGLDRATLDDLRSLRAGKAHPHRDSVLDLFSRTLRMLDALAGRVENEDATA